MLLYKGVTLGVPSHWMPSNSKFECRDLIKVEEERDFVPCTQPVPHEMHTQALGNNCIATVPDNAFLSTIPLNCDTFTKRSFISLFRGRRALEIGIVNEGNLFAVFSISPNKETTVSFHLMRLKRYFESQYPETHFPGTVAVIGGEPIGNIEEYAVEHIDCSVLVQDSFSEERIRAAGVALAGVEPWSVPLFS
ncbi:MAG: hypothetical protein GF350_11310, partial [Chitinivibrionales bacterium]|nr:hypothetical protein [Chitinivibrionales bacterium]